MPRADCRPRVGFGTDRSRGLPDSSRFPEARKASASSASADAAERRGCKRSLMPVRDSPPFRPQLCGPEPQPISVHRAGCRKRCSMPQIRSDRLRVGNTPTRPQNFRRAAFGNAPARAVLGLQTQRRQIGFNRSRRSATAAGAEHFENCRILGCRPTAKADRFCERCRWQGSATPDDSQDRTRFADVVDRARTVVESDQAEMMQRRITGAFARRRSPPRSYSPAYKYVTARDVTAIGIDLVALRETSRTPSLFAVHGSLIECRLAQSRTADRRVRGAARSPAPADRRRAATIRRGKRGSPTAPAEPEPAANHVEHRVKIKPNTVTPIIPEKPQFRPCSARLRRPPRPAARRRE